MQSIRQLKILFDEGSPFGDLQEDKIPVEYHVRVKKRVN
jgi:hypothetical protein